METKVQIKNGESKLVLKKKRKKEKQSFLRSRCKIATKNIGAQFTHLHKPSLSNDCKEFLRCATTLD